MFCVWIKRSVVLVFAPSYQHSFSTDNVTDSVFLNYGGLQQKCDDYERAGFFLVSTFVTDCRLFDANRLANGRGRHSHK